MSGIVAVRLGNGERGLAWVKSIMVSPATSSCVHSMLAFYLFSLRAHSHRTYGSRCDTNIDSVLTFSETAPRSYIST
eukprot:scaffold26504_cov228-Skeletonema_dohrnii-CCMP3373.AAC.4